MSGTTSVDPPAQSEEPKTMDPDPENQNPRISSLTRFSDILLLPFNMFAPLPDYALAYRLSMHTNELVRDSLLKVLIDAQNFRTKQWRIAYWTMAVSLICTIGTAFIGIATAIMSFNQHLTISKILSITLAGFGVTLTLFKGIGQPANAFVNLIKTVDIIDDIEDFSVSNKLPNAKQPEDIITSWRGLRDTSIANRASVWTNLKV